MSFLEKFGEEIKSGIGGLLLGGNETIEGAEVHQPGPETTTKIDPVIKVDTAPAPDAGQLPGVILSEEKTRDELQAVKDSERESESNVERLLANQKASLANQEKAEIVAVGGIVLALVIFFLRK